MKEKDDELTKALYALALRNRWLGWSLITVLVLLFWATMSVSDEAILFQEDVQLLPFSKLNVPIAAYFRWIPALILVFHAIYLFRLNQYGHQLRAWFFSLNSEEQEHHALLLPKNTLNTLIIPPLQWSLSLGLRRVMLELGLFFLPCWLLLTFQLKWSAFQDLESTTWQLLIILADVFLMVVYRASLFRLDGWRKEIHLATTSEQTSGIPAFSVFLMNLTHGFWSFLRYLPKVLQNRIPAFRSFRKGTLFVMGLLGLKLLFWLTLGVAGFNFYLVKKLVSEEYLEAEQWMAKPRWYVYRPMLEVKKEPKADSLSNQSSTILRNSKRNLQGRYLRFAELQHINLAEAALQGIKAEKSKWQNVVFSGAQLDSVNFSFAEISQSDWSETKAANRPGNSPAKFNYTFFLYTDLANSDWENADLKGMHVFESNLQKANWRSVQMQGSVFSDVIMDSMNLSQAQLQGVMIHESSLKAVDFSQANLQAIEMKLNELHGAKLNGVNLSHWKPNKLSGLKNIESVGVDYHWDKDWSKIEMPRGTLKMSFFRRMKRAEKRWQVTLDSLVSASN